MSRWLMRLRAISGSRWALIALAPALILGIVAMHSLLAQSSHAASDEMQAMVASSAHHAQGEAVMAQAVASPDQGERGHENPVPDCGDLVAMCLALLITAAVCAVSRRSPLLRVLWQRPPPTLLRLGDVRAAFERLTPLQRTAVIRC